MAITDNLGDFLTGVANAIRNVDGTTQPINAQDFATRIEDLGSIVTPSDKPTLITKEITENGTYKASDYGADGYSEVVVNVAQGNPIEATTDTEMTNALVEDNLGKVYKFTGTSDTYETDAIYIVSEV
jgi:hypothetical protein